MKKKILAMLLAMVTVVMLLPMTALAAGENVRVIIENTTFTTAAQSADGQTAPAWSGTLLDTQVSAYQDMTMMEAIGAALTAHGYTAEGLYSGYISSINGLAEKEGLGQNSGWMGTLNDWFVNEGFSNFTVGNGDVVRVMYTNANSGGTDLGGTWDNNVKSLSALGISAGALTPSFSAGTPNYTLTLPAGTNSVTVTPAAMNKNFQVRVKTDAEGFDAVRWGARTLSVINGDTITVTCGDPTWPSMNNGAPPTGNYAELVPAGSYTITVSIDNPAPVSAQTPVFFTDLSATPVAYDAGQTAIPLTAEAVVTDGGTITYQWYSSTNNVDFYPMGETGTSLMPSTVTAGTTYYYVIATNTLGESAASATSAVATVTVADGSTPVTAAAPTFTTDLSTVEVSYTAGQSAASLTVAATVTDGGTVTYQWFTSTVSSTAGSLPVGAGDTFTPPTANTGTMFYYAVATNTLGDSTASALSAVACVTVIPEVTGTHNLTFRVAPSTVTVTFYATTGYDADGVDLYDASSPLTASDGGVLSGYHIYTVIVPDTSETISFRGTDASGNALGGMTADAANAINGVITLRQTEPYIRTSDNASPTAAQAQVVIRDADYRMATYGSTYAGADGRTRFRYLLFAGGNAELFTYYAVPQGELAQTHGTFVGLNKTISVEASVAVASLTILPLCAYTITAPDGACVQIFDQLRNFCVAEVSETGSVVNGDGTTSHIYSLSGANGSLTYRVSMPGRITKAGYISGLTGEGGISVAWTAADAAPGTRVNDVSSKTLEGRLEESVLLNVNSRNCLELNAGAPIDCAPTAPGRLSTATRPIS